MTKTSVARRTFEALKHPAGSAERARANECALTSEYYTSLRYCLKRPNLMSDGTPHPTQPFHYQAFRTKAEAEAAI